MPVADLYGVTASLRNLVRYNIWRLTSINVTITDLPPEKAEEGGASNLNLHLFHAVEDPSKRNEFPRDSQGAFPIAEAPLPLVLYYVLTAHSIGNDADVPGQQRLMGLAMKTLHDFPAFDERLVLPTPPVNVVQPAFDARMRGNQNRIEVFPRQLTPEESINFWSAAQNHTARLTAYYEVHSTLLPPDEPQVKAGVVIGYGLGVAVAGRPRLVSTSSVQTVTLPAALGGGTLATTLSPAEAAIGSTAVPSAARVSVIGGDLGDGTAEVLLLQGPDGEIEIDPAANPDWVIRFAGDTLSFVVQPSAVTLRDGFITTVPIRPGVWPLSVRRKRALAVSSGAARTGVTQSNRVPFAIGAAVAGTTVLAAPPRLRIDLAPGINALTVEADSELSIAGDVYRWHPPADPAALVVGEYQAVSATRLEVLLTFDPADGETRLVRLGLAGVDCAPFWVGP
jgi:hypothetical protein